MQHGRAQGAHGARATAARGRAGHSAAGAEGTRSARCNATGICRCTCWCTAFCNTATWQCEGRRAAGPRRPRAEQCMRVARMGPLHAAVRRWLRRRSRGGGAGKTQTRIFCNGILRLRQFRNGWTRCDHTELEATILGRPPTWRTKAARPKPSGGEEGGSTTGGMRCTAAAGACRGRRCASRHSCVRLRPLPQPPSAPALPWLARRLVCRCHTARRNPRRRPTTCPRPPWSRLPSRP